MKTLLAFALPILLAILPNSAQAQSVSFSFACLYFTTSAGGCVPPATTGMWLSSTGWASLPTGSSSTSAEPNQVLAGPASGTTAGTPSPRALVPMDMPPSPISRHSGAYQFTLADLGVVSALHGAVVNTTWTFPAIGSAGFSINGETFILTNDSPVVLSLSSTSAFIGPTTLCQYGYDIAIVDVVDSDWQILRSSDGTCP